MCFDVGNPRCGTCVCALYVIRSRVLVVLWVARSFVHVGLTFLQTFC